MGRKSKTEILEDEMIADLKRLAFAPDTGQSARSRYMGTLAGLIRRKTKRAAETAARAAARRAAEPLPIYNVLPRNGREPPPDWKPAQVRPFRIPRGVNKG
jgi:hypothetical protein